MPPDWSCLLSLTARAALARRSGTLGGCPGLRFRTLGWLGAAAQVTAPGVRSDSAEGGAGLDGRHRPDAPRYESEATGYPA
jgi:hypothetical protein